MDANGFPLTIMVYVSSFSVDIKLPNQDRFVNSGEGSGVGFSDISSTMINQTIFKAQYIFIEVYNSNLYKFISYPLYTLQFPSMESWRSQKVILNVV